jgi:hypothetical protein
MIGIYYVCQIAISYVISLLINFLSRNDPLWMGLLYVLAFFVAGLFSFIAYGLNQNYAYSIGTCIKMCTTMLVYKKAIRLNNQELGAVGKLINICATDIEQFELTGVTSQAFMVPVYSVVAAVYLRYMLGVIGLIGIGIIMGSSPYKCS